MEPNRPQERQYPVEGFSLTERDRRWKLVRTLMDSAGIDFLVATSEADSRYLSQMHDQVGPTILPLTGQVTALCDQGRVGSAAQRWLTDIRCWNQRWTDGIIDRLQELKADGKIVGVVGLDGTIRRPDGNLNYNTFVRLREAFPHTRWIGATELMQEARYRKSAEEVEFLTRAARGADAGLLAAVAHLRPGVSDRELWGQMVLAMLEAGTDPPRLAHLGLADLNDTRELPAQPVGLQAERGNVLFAQVNGRYCGYEAQGAQPAALGPIPQNWQDAWSVHVEAWERTMAMLRPGVTLEQVVKAVEPAASGPFTARQTIHGQGLGDDIPLIAPSSSHSRGLADRVLEEGVCFVLKPYAEWTDTRGERELGWGDTVVITHDGARRLGTRQHELIRHE